MDSNQSSSKKSCPEQLEDLIRYLDSQLAQLDYPDGRRVCLAMATFGVALEHIFAIAQLFRLDMYSSAFVLIRPTLEATIKGTWIHLCASESQINKYANGSELASIKELLKELESSKLPKDVFDNLKDSHDFGYKVYSSFNHAGYHQIYERAVQGNAPIYSDEDMKDATNTLLVLGLVAGLEFARMSGNERVITELSSHIPQ